MDYPFEQFIYTLIDDDAHVVIDPDVNMPAFIADNCLLSDEVQDMNERHENRQAHVFSGGAMPQYSLIRSRRLA